MALFGSAAKQVFELTPRAALAIGMVYVIAADGQLQDVERDDVRKVIPDDAVLNQALDYCRRIPTSQFIGDCRTLLNAEQKLCMLLNMWDAAMVDGEVGEEELAILEEFRAGFEISTPALAPHVESLTLKNNRHSFGT